MHNTASYWEFFLKIAGYPDFFIYVNTTTISMLILPLSISLILWYAMPAFIKKWYSLELLPSKYSYVYDLVQKIASRMEISPPALLYTQKDIANCFNLGKKESESTIVVSNWLLHRLELEELEAIFAHEMAHTKNRDVTLAAYFAAVRWAILLSPLFVFCGFIYLSFRFNYSPIHYLYFPDFWILIIPFFLAYILLNFGILWFSRLREGVADARASLFIDKNTLKRTLYKLASARSMRMAFVSSCLVISSAHGFGGILSTHPALYERYKMLDKRKYIIDPSKPLSFRFCFTSAASIFVFTQLIIFISSALYLFIIKQTPQDMPFLFISPVITAFLLVLYYEYISWKYFGVIILLIAFLRFIISFLFVLLFYLFVLSLLLPVVEVFPPEYKSMTETILMWGTNLSGTVIELLKHEVKLLIITSLIIIFLKYARKYFISHV